MRRRPDGLGRAPRQWNQNEPIATVASTETGAPSRPPWAIPPPPRTADPGATGRQVGRLGARALWLCVRGWGNLPSPNRTDGASLRAGSREGQYVEVTFGARARSSGRESHPPGFAGIHRKPRGRRLESGPNKAAAPPAPTAPLPRVVVHPGGHYLQTEDGRPFFWLGDTAWQLVHATTREECSYYLHTRARRATASSRRWCSPIGRIAARGPARCAPLRGRRSLRSPNEHTSTAWSRSSTRRRVSGYTSPSCRPGATRSRRRGVTGRACPPQ